MAINLVILNRKFFNQIKNGTTFASNTGDYTTNLVGSVGERVKHTFDVKLDWSIGSQNGNDFTFVASGHVKQITGNFFDNGFAIGDTFDYTKTMAGGGGADIVFSGVVTGLTSDGLNIYYTVSSGAEPAVSTVDTDRYFRGTTVINALEYKFGLIENGETVNFINKATLDTQGYAFKDLSSSTTGIVLNAVQSWETGGITCSVPSVSGIYFQTFTVTHTFTIPYFEVGDETFYDAGTNPPDFAGGNTLKYVCSMDFRMDYSNPNGAKKAIDDINLGSVGWFNENINGLASLYSFDSIVYTDADLNVIDGIQRAGVTHVVAIVNGTIGATSRYGVYISKGSLQTVTNISTDWDDLYLYDNMIEDVNGVATDSTIITNCSCTDYATYVQYEFDVEYSAPQQLTIQPTDFFIIGLQIADDTISNVLTDKTTFMIGDCYGAYICDSDVTGLLVWRDNRYYNHLQNYPDTTAGLTLSQHDYKGWIEDGILNNFNFDLNIDLAVAAYLQGLNVKFVAYNNATDRYFVISEYTWNTALGIYAPLSGTAYNAFQIDIQTKRDFNLPIGDQFNLVKLENALLPLNTSWLNYNAVTTFKIDWQKWILNPNVDLSFINISELFKGLNQHSSQYIYSDWQLKFLYTATVGDINHVLTNYEFLSPRILIKDYDVDGYTPPKWVGAITTWTEDEAQNLAARILSNANTLFKTVWTFDTATYGVMGDEYDAFYCIHRIEEHYIQSSSNIEELSSLRYNLNQKLKPVVGQTLLKVEVGVSTVTSKCLIDFTQLNKGMNYKLSSRLFAQGTAVGLTWEEINIHWEDITQTWEIL